MIGGDRGALDQLQEKHGWSDDDVARLKRLHERGVPVPDGTGLGVSAPEEEWTDRSQPRPVKVEPLCNNCIGERLGTSAHSG